MKEAGFWKPRRRKIKHRKRRERRSLFGQMVQADGSPNDWFEGRGERCNETMQDRLSKEMRLAGISSIDLAKEKNIIGYLPPIHHKPGYNSRRWNSGLYPGE